jgi:hypothetical protein
MPTKLPSFETTPEVHQGCVDDHLILEHEAKNYCKEHGLSEHLREIYKTANTCFRIIGKPVVKLERDPEDGEGYLVIAGQVLGNVDENYDANERFIDLAIDRFDIAILSQIRFLYEIIQS